MPTMPKSKTKSTKTSTKIAAVGGITPAKRKKTKRTKKKVTPKSKKSIWETVA